MKRMKILVLGGTGAIGRPTVKKLSDKEHAVYVTSRKEHNSEDENIRYLHGNAYEDDFLKQILNETHYDVIVDFMNYRTKVFSQRVDMLLNSTEHYIFLSSGRVYADSGNEITEDSPRLLDICEDEEFLKTDDYALAKARCEDLLKRSGRSNWTIVRPYIAYNNNRLQLGIWEKEHWLYRAVRGRAIVFFRDLAPKRTTLTYACDAASRIADIACGGGYGEIINVAGDEAAEWKEVLEIYLNAIEKAYGIRPKVYMADSSEVFAEMIGSKYKLKYDRVYDRRFSNVKEVQLLGQGERYVLKRD